jgi:hypothetical protein
MPGTKRLFLWEIYLKSKDFHYMTGQESARRFFSRAARSVAVGAVTRKASLPGWTFSSTNGCA